MLLNGLLTFAETMESIGGILLAILILLAMVTVHEFGHYVAGKILGFKINEFSVGFGPALFEKRSKKTGELFALRLIPLGGYCAFDGEDELDEEENSQEPSAEEPFAEMTEKTENDGGRVATNFETNAETEVESPSLSNVETEAETQALQGNVEEYPEPQGERFNDQPPWKRIIVLIAGATMNYLLALVLIVLMFACIGRPVYRVERAVPTSGAETVSAKSQDTVLEVFTWQTGDVILEINGKTPYLITDYIDAFNGKKVGEQVPVLIRRDGKEQSVQVTMLTDVNCVNMTDTGTLLRAIGFTTGDMLVSQTEKDGFFETLGHSFLYSFKIGGTVLRSLGELLTGKLGMDSVGGPVTTITLTAEAATNGWASFLSIAAFIGVNLAVFNLLPIPALDGCKVIFCIIEWIFKKPVNRKVEAIIHFVGIILLFGFAILVDLLQLFAW